MLVVAAHPDHETPGRGGTIAARGTTADGAGRMDKNVSTDGDPRITSARRFLCVGYLDELSQLVGHSTLARMDEAGRLAPVEDAAGHHRNAQLQGCLQMDVTYLEGKSLVHDVALLLRQVVGPARH